MVFLFQDDSQKVHYFANVVKFLLEVVCVSFKESCRGSVFSLFSVSSEFVPKEAFDQIFEHSSQPREARLDVGARRWIHVIDHLLQGLRLLVRGLQLHFINPLFHLSRIDFECFIRVHVVIDGPFQFDALLLVGLDKFSEPSHISHLL